MYINTTKDVTCCPIRIPVDEDIEAIPLSVRHFQMVRKTIREVNVKE